MWSGPSEPRPRRPGYPFCPIPEFFLLLCNAKDKAGKKKKTRQISERSTLLARCCIEGNVVKITIMKKLTAVEQANPPSVK